MILPQTISRSLAECLLVSQQEAQDLILATKDSLSATCWTSRTHDKLRIDKAWRAYSVSFGLISAVSVWSRKHLTCRLHQSRQQTDQQDDSTGWLHNSIYTWITTIPRRHVRRGDLIVTVRPWWYVHNDVYGNLFLAVSRLTLHPWQLAPVVQNTVFTDRSCNHPGVRSLIGIRSMPMTARPGRSVRDTSFVETLPWRPVHDDHLRHGYVPSSLSNKPYS